MIYYFYFSVLFRSAAASSDRGAVTSGMGRGEGSEGGDRLFGRYVIFSGNSWNIQNSPYLNN
ncbi:hypothetical protein [Microcoleus vaginatus]|uniref:hypothetical protein n=1 Tax=Microcoleus vaginatus TaxID=119532 RepID=UPI001F61CC43